MQTYINHLKGSWTPLDSLINNTLQNLSASLRSIGIKDADFSKRDLDRFINFMTGITYHFYLGGFIFNVATPLTNLSQLINTYSIVGEKTMMQAFESLKSGEYKLIQDELIDNNVIGFGSLHLYDSEKFESSDNKILLLNTYLFDKSEYANKLVTSIAAYKKSDQLGLTGKEKYTFIRRLVQETQFDGSKSGTPLFFTHSSILRIPGQFQSFFLKQLKFFMTSHIKFARNCFDLIKDPGNDTKKLKAKEAIKQITRLNVGLAIIGGVNSAPLIGLSTAVVGGFSLLLAGLGLGDKDWLKEAFDYSGLSKLLRDYPVFIHGIFSLIGVDLSSSVKLGTPKMDGQLLQGASVGSIIKGFPKTITALETLSSDPTSINSWMNVVKYLPIRNRAASNIIDSYIAFKTGYFLNEHLKVEFPTAQAFKKLSNHSKKKLLKTNPEFFKELYRASERGTPFSKPSTYTKVINIFGLKPLERTSNIESYFEIQKELNTIKKYKQNKLSEFILARKAKNMEKAKSIAKELIGEGYYKNVETFEGAVKRSMKESETYN